MAQENIQKLSKWIFWKPAKFALILFLSFFITILICTAISESFKPIPYPAIYIVLSLIFIGNIIMLIRPFKNTPMDRRSFIAIINAQWLISTILSIILLPVLLIGNTNSIITKSVLAITLLAFIGIIISLIALYSIGCLTLCLYAIYRRCVELKIPTWKFILSFPFGTLMFNTAGYLMNDPQKKKSSIEIKSNWYSRLTDWIIKNKRNTVIALIITILISGLSTGFNSVLLAISMLLLYNIWISKTGEKKLQKTIGGKYSSVAVIINIALIIGTILLSILLTIKIPEIESTQTSEQITIEETVNTTQAQQ